MDEAYQQAMAHIAARKQALAQTLGELFSEPTSLVFEIGCGHGHFLTAYAEAHPQCTALGIDLISKRIDKSQSKAQKRGLTHAHFLKAELMECLEALPEHVSLERVFMLFPDPWPKKRHFKNRMIQPAFLSTLATRCARTTPFHFRTDHEGYFEWTCEHLEAHPDWVIEPEAAWPFEQETYFEKVTGFQYQSLTAVRS